MNRVLFEVSWEVCNKVGGIYTVIESKIKAVKKEFKDNYYLIGPLFENNPEFEETDDLQEERKKLNEFGFSVKVGRWKNDEKPKVILVKYKNVQDQNKLLYQLWEDYSVNSMAGAWDYIEPVIFSTIAGKVIEVISSLYNEHEIIAQFHEWMCGAGLLYLKKKVPDISTIFTMHSTVLGRSMAGTKVDIYNILSDINPDYEASKFNVLAKHSIESATAREADCFTTVSEITGIEAKHLLKMEPDVLVYNGFNVKAVPDFKTNKNYFTDNKKKLLSFASKFLQKDFNEEDTVIFSNSGRYEFHNKGLDLLLEALSELNKETGKLNNKKILVFLFILTGSVDMSQEKHVKKDDKIPFTVYSSISTHPLWNPHNDPIVNTCIKNNLQNNQGDKINIIFVPAYLNGHDGILNMEYYDTLSGCDLTLYPSYYEPWGYAPLESIAYSVPTISTDVAGFGRWILKEKKKSKGIMILHRLDNNYIDSVEELKKYIEDFLKLDVETILYIRSQIKDIALTAEWNQFIKNYLKAFDIAVKECRSRLQGSSKKKLIHFEGLQYRGADSQRPRFHQFSVKSPIPEKISGLRDLAYNIWWSWNPDGRDLFSLLNIILYEKTGYNPISLLDLIEPERLEEFSENENYMRRYNNVMGRYGKYISEKKCLLEDAEIFTKETPVAYFSMEYGFHESLPIYSGGLGILSGDHIKSSSDLNINLIGIGLLYKSGYFKQGISKEGDQKVEYFHNDFFRMPIKELNVNGEKVIISIEYPGRKVSARVWEAKVGRVSVYFFDTDIQENNPADRSITDRLYGGGKQVRIEQEILLGIGGIKLINRMGLKPSVYHLNEGHSAFLIIERLINYIKDKGLDLATAREVVKVSTVFTTHTPVPAGNETFDMSLVQNYLKSYVEQNGLSWQDFCELGHKNISDTGPYEMTVLALKNTYKRNGVSKLHGKISRKMWSGIWTGFLDEEVPIKHITNGVHASTWISDEMKNIFLKYCSLNTNEDLLNTKEWKRVADIPDEILWQTHANLKNKLYNLIKETITINWTREGEDPTLLDKFLVSLSPGPLTIGFARRFATYKRATLFLSDISRLKKLLLNKKFPVQFVFAGKAHPHDSAAFGLIKQIVNLSKREEFLGKIVFLEGYNMNVASKMLSGVDIWLNNPRRPLEASGTSGQKAGMNGVVNFSILDGWWDEAYDGTNGFCIGDRKEYKNSNTQDLVDSDSLYDTLENDIIPLYYLRNSRGLPEKWIKIMKSSIISTISNYNTHRMIKDYVEKLYVPTAKKYLSLYDKDFKKLRSLAEWRKSIRTRFPGIHIQDIAIEGINGDILNVGDKIDFSLEVNKGKISSDEITAQIIIFQDCMEDSIAFLGEEKICCEELVEIPMNFHNEDLGIICFKGEFTAIKSGKFNYGIRILPYHKDIDDIMDLNLVFWG